MGKFLRVTSPSFGDICTRKSASNLRMFLLHACSEMEKIRGSPSLYTQGMFSCATRRGKKHLDPDVKKNMDLGGHNSPRTFIKIFLSKPVIFLLSTYRNLSWTILWCWVFNTLTPEVLWSSVLRCDTTSPRNFGVKPVNFYCFQDFSPNGSVTQADLWQGEWNTNRKLLS